VRHYSKFSPKTEEAEEFWRYEVGGSFEVYLDEIGPFIFNPYLSGSR